MTTAPAPSAPPLRLVEDVIRPKPKQREFLAAMDTHKYVLFGGAAGPGKSFILRWGLVVFLARQFKRHKLRGVRVGLFCETYRDLEDRQIAKVRSEFPPWLGSYHEGRHEFTLAKEFGAGVIAFRNLADPEQYRSVEFAAIAVDELTMDSHDDFDDLRSRLRWPGVEHSPFLAASNPTGPGHDWVKRLWVDGDFGAPEDDALNPADFVFIRALSADNDSLPASYYDTLRSLPLAKRKAFLDGDWEVFTGQAFPEFRPRDDAGRPFHVIPARAIPQHWRRMGGHDWGYAALCYTCWGALDPEGGIVIYRELAVRGLGPSDLAATILLTQGSDNVAVMWAGHDVTQEHRSRLTQEQLRTLQEKGQLQLSILDHYRRAGLKNVQLCGNLDRHARVQTVHELMGPRPDGAPYLRIMDNCPVLIKTLSRLQADKSDPEDVQSIFPANAEVRDDPYDGLGHMLMSLPRMVRPAPVSAQRREQQRLDVVDAPPWADSGPQRPQYQWGGRK